MRSSTLRVVFISWSNSGSSAWAMGMASSVKIGKSCLLATGAREQTRASPY